MKKKMWIPILGGSAMALMAVGGALFLKARTPSLVEAAATETDTAVTGIVSPTSPYISFVLSVSDYGDDVSYRPTDMDAKMAASTMLDYIYVNDSTTAIGGTITIASRDPYVNLYGAAQYSFTLNLGSLPTKILIKAGCEFPSHAYLSGATDYAVYKTSKDALFTYNADTSAWAKSYNHTALAASTFSLARGKSETEGPEYNLVSSVPFFKTEYLMDHDQDLQNYLTVNGTSVADLNASVDDTDWSYPDFPGSLGGVYAVPIRVYASNDGAQQIFTLHIHSKLFDTLGKVDTIGLKVGFAFPIDETNAYWLDGDVNLSVLSAPTDVAVTPAAKGYAVSFTGCLNATSYTLNIYDSASKLVASETIENGGLITSKLAHADYTVKVAANEANSTSVESAAGVAYSPDDADSWVVLFNAATASCDATGDSKGVTTEAWANLKAVYDRLHADYQSTLKAAVSNVNGTDMEKALARYDYILGKYSESDYATIFEHSSIVRPAAGALADPLVSVSPTQEAWGISLFLVLAAGLGVGSLLFYRHKKEQR